MTLRSLPRVLAALSTLLILAAASSAVQALGFGRSTPNATMGYPLDFSVALRLDPGETVSAECVAAEVIVGDQALQRHQVSATLEGPPGAPLLRVRTQQGVEEPVVGVTVTVGCESRIARRFTLLSDPPGATPAAPPVADVLAAATPVTAPTPAAAAAAPAGTSPAPAAGGAAAPGVGAKTAEATPRAARKPRPRAPTPPLAARAAAAKAEPARARLQLESPIVSPSAARAAAAAASAVVEREIALRAAEEAAGSARAAASAAEARVTAMERELQALRKESQANRELMAQLNRTLVQAEDRGRWTPMLLAAVLGLAAMVIWLAWKLRQSEKQRDSAWWVQQSQLAEGAAGAPVPAVSAQAAAEGSAGHTDGLSTSPVALGRGGDLTAVQERTITLAAAKPTAAPPSAATAHDEQTISLGPRVAGKPAVDTTEQTISQRTLPLPPGSTLSGAPSRDVSIEELLDLEQQAEFFIVLGQDEAAIDLLVGHLRSTGGTVPLPYLKLLEIYRRLGDEPAYERTRDRFNQRFNAIAPGWGTDLNAGRTLEDYHEVMTQIERVWPEPVDAMAVLETSLFRTDASEMFDLPAYREVLFLYSLARDLLDRSATKGAHVDVLLPLADGSEYATTSARPYLSGDFADSTLDIVVDNQPTAPVDLDLTPPPDAAPARATSQFGFLEPGSTPPDGKPRR